MKKTVFYAVLFLSLISLGMFTLFAQETSQTPQEESVYTYKDYDDLLNQIKEGIYADVYASVYDDVYQNIIAEINQATYNQIYADIEEEFTNHLGSMGVLHDDTQNKIFEVVDIANQSVVGVETYMDDEGVSLGSAVIYKYDEVENLFYIISNEHVVEGGNNFKIRFEDESTVEATLLETNVSADIALLSFSAENLDDLKPAALGTSTGLKKGSILLAAGHPKGFNFYGSITMGIVAGVDRLVEGEDITYIQHDAAINSGNSGGPIFNLNGEVIGINVLKYASQEIEGMGFSIPIDLVLDIIANYESK